MAPRNTPSPQQLLLAACRSGGDGAEIQRLLTSYRYGQADIDAAREVLSSSAASALENQLAQRNRRLLEHAWQRRQDADRLTRR